MSEAPRRTHPLSPARWTTLEPMIDELLAQPTEARQLFLKEKYASDAALRDELEQLLAEYERADTLLDHPAAERFPSLLRREAAPLPAVLSERYRIEREIGRGGMATVYLAHDIRHDREVAVKVLHPDFTAVVGAERFLAEIKTTARLQHAHILPLYDSGEADGLLFYVMPYVGGGSLRQRMSRECQMQVEDVARIACEVASALDAAHRQGVIHRDIKPENILLHNGFALVADFGIALAVSAGTEPRLTLSGFTVGTPRYMSPEQATGARALDGRSDIYSLGAVMYEMLAGEPPFTGPTTAAMVAKMLSLPAPSLRVVRAAVPELLDTAVSTALAREPADRYRTAGEFAVALQRSLIPRVSGAQPPPPAIRAVRRRIALPLLGLLVASLATWGVAVRQRSRREAAAQDLTSVDAAVKSIAVLPLTIPGSDTADRYFAEGMTDDLSSALGRVAGLRVLPGRSAAGLLKGTDPDFKDLGLKLGVGTLLEGAVRREGTQRTVTIYLVSTRDGSMLWSRRYSKEVHAARDVYAMRDEIVTNIVEQLRLTLAGPSAPVQVRHPTEDLEAYDWYNRAEYFLNQGGPDETTKAVHYFQQAIAKDPGFADAYSGLSQAYSWYGASDAIDYRPDEFFPKARTAAQHALLLDSASADAHAALGFVRVLYDLDWEGAERELRRAVDLNPHSRDALASRATMFYFTGRFEEAIADARAALQGEPLHTRRNVELGRTLLMAKRFGQASVQLSQALERDSTLYRAHLLLGEVLEQQRMFDSAVVEMKRAVRFAPNSSRARAFLAHAYALSGRTPDALRELAALQQRARSGGYVPAFNFAVVYVGLGRHDETFAWLRKSIGDHSLRPYLMDPTFDPIRSDRRYLQLLRQLHHPLAAAAR